MQHTLAEKFISALSLISTVYDADQAFSFVFAWAKTSGQARKIFGGLGVWISYVTKGMVIHDL